MLFKATSFLLPFTGNGLLLITSVDSGIILRYGGCFRIIVLLFSCDCNGNSI